MEKRQCPLQSDPEAHGQAASTAGLYGTLLEDNNLGYSIQSGYTRGGYEGSSKTGYASLNYRGDTVMPVQDTVTVGGYRQLYYGLSGGILAHANGLTLSQPLGDTLILVRAPGASDTRIENQTGVSTDWRGMLYCLMQQTIVKTGWHWIPTPLQIMLI